MDPVTELRKDVDSLMAMFATLLEVHQAEMDKIRELVFITDALLGHVKLSTGHIAELRRLAADQARRRYARPGD